MGSFFVRVPYYIGELKRGPTLENYPFWRGDGCGSGNFAGAFPCLFVRKRLQLMNGVSTRAVKVQGSGFSKQELRVQGLSV